MREHFSRIEATGATILAIAPSVGQKAESFIARSGAYPFDLLCDEDHHVFDLYDVTAKLRSLGQRPAMFVLDANGIVTYNQVGTQQVDLPTIDEIMNELESLDERTNEQAG